MMLALTMIWGERNIQGVMLLLSVSRTLTYSEHVL